MNYEAAPHAQNAEIRHTVFRNVCICICVCLLSYKTGEPIEMPFGMLTRVGPTIHALDGSPDPQRKGPFWGSLHASCRQNPLTSC